MGFMVSYRLGRSDVSRAEARLFVVKRQFDLMLESTLQKQTGEAS